MSKFDKSKYDNEYIKENYKRTAILLKKDEYDNIKSYCDDMNLPLGTLTKMCLKYCVDNVHIDELKRYK